MSFPLVALAVVVVGTIGYIIGVIAGRSSMFSVLDDFRSELHAFSDQYPGAKLTPREVLNMLRGIR